MKRAASRGNERAGQHTGQAFGGSFLESTFVRERREKLRR